MVLLTVQRFPLDTFSDHIGLVQGLQQVAELSPHKLTSDRNRNPKRPRMRISSTPRHCRGRKFLPIREAKLLNLNNY